MKASFKEDPKNTTDAKLITKIRNLENIIYVPLEEVQKARNLIELQLLIDSVTPFVIKESAETHIKNKQKVLYKYKLQIESLRALECDKEKLLGLPFMMDRNKQYPEPARGTWQYDLFKELFGNSYEEGKHEFETEEKIHKFNYKKFLHPSVIEKFNDGKFN